MSNKTRWHGRKLFDLLINFSTLGALHPLQWGSSPALFRIQPFIFGRSCKASRKKTSNNSLNRSFAEALRTWLSKSA
jgi:hypothetical protein